MGTRDREALVRGLEGTKDDASRAEALMSWVAGTGLSYDLPPQPEREVTRIAQWKRPADGVVIATSGGRRRALTPRVYDRERSRRWNANRRGRLITLYDHPHELLARVEWLLRENEVAPSRDTLDRIACSLIAGATTYEQASDGHLLSLVTSVPVGSIAFWCLFALLRTPDTPCEDPWLLRWNDREGRATSELPGGTLPPDPWGEAMGVPMNPPTPVRWPNDPDSAPVYAGQATHRVA